MKKYIIILSIILVSLFGIFYNNVKVVKAESLNDEIYNQLDKIDFTDIEKFYDELNINFNKSNFIDNIYKIVSGEFNADFNGVFQYLITVFSSNLNELKPALICLIIIGILCGLLKIFRAKIIGENVGETVFFVCYLAEIIIVFALIYSVFNTVQKTIDDICKFSELISPILLTLMVASGGSVSASIFKPAIVFFTNGVSNLINVVILPLICIMLIFNVVSQFSREIKFTKFADTIASIIKWILGLIFIVFGVFLTVQGVAGGAFDGISFKATKYALSNSIPIVGGFIKDSFDIVASGSVLIKNAIGVSGIIGVFYIIISPLIMIGGVSITLKTCSALIEPITDSRICAFTTSISKTLTYLTAVLVVVGVMFLINIFLIITCGNLALV